MLNGIPWDQKRISTGISDASDASIYQPATICYGSTRLTQPWFDLLLHIHGLQLTNRVRQLTNRSSPTRWEGRKENKTAPLRESLLSESRIGMD